MACGEHPEHALGSGAKCPRAACEQNHAPLLHKLHEDGLDENSAGRPACALRMGVLPCS